MAERALAEGDHNIIFGNARLLNNTTSYYARLDREATGIYKHKNNFDEQEESLKLNPPSLSNHQTHIRTDASGLPPSI